MCKNSTILSSSKNGQLTICNSCKRYSLTFNNILLQFDKDELKSFRKHINNIDVDYWLDFYARTTKVRKIPVSTKQCSLWMFFSEEEFEELKSLLSINRKQKNNLLARDINYPLILN